MKNNLGIKIFSLIIGILIWTQITLMANHQTKVNIDLKLSNQAVSDSAFSTGKTVPCLVQGRGIDIIKLHYSKVYILMTENDLQSGNKDKFEIEDLPVNLNVEILGIDPSYFSSIREPREGDGNRFSETNAGIDDPIQTHLTSIQIPLVSGRRFFPDSITLKLKVRASIIPTLPQGVVINVADTPDARGMYTIKVQVPDDVGLLDFNPKQVRLVK